MSAFEDEHLSSIPLSSVTTADPLQDESVKLAASLSEEDLNGGYDDDIEAQTLEFQETEGLLSASGSIDAGGRKQGSGPAPTAAASGASGGGGSRLCSPFSIQYYQPYFDVDAVDVGRRLLSACTPWRCDFLEAIGERPDMYGPFWICSTLVFTIAATANLSSWFVHDAGGEPWQYDLALLTSAASLVYGCAVFMPAVAYFALKYLAVTLPLGFVQLLCLYGYSILPFVPACMLSAVPFASVQWLSLLVAFGFSAGFLIGNLWGFLSPQLEVGQGAGPRKRSLTILAALVGLHVVFVLLLKLWFFSKFE